MKSVQSSWEVSVEKFDLIVVGGGPAGFNAVKTVKLLYPDKSVLLVNDREDVQIPCSIPYVLAGSLSLQENRYPLSKLANLGVHILIAKVTSIDSVSCKVFANGKAYTYSRLIIATGWLPRMLGVSGEDLEGVHYISTSTSAVERLAREVAEAKNIVVVGAGLIGLSLADLFSSAGKSVTLVEATSNLAAGLFSEDIENLMLSALKEKGVKVVKENTVSGFEGRKRVESVLLKSGDTVPADCVLIAIGFKPNSSLALEAGAEVDAGGAVVVDEYMRTSVDNILSAGSCVRHRSAIDRSFVPAMLASVSARDGRIAGVNAFEPQIKDAGIVPAGMTQVNNTFFGFAGYTGSSLKTRQDCICTTVESSSAYPGAMRGSGKLIVKLYFSSTLRLIGAEFVSGSRVVTGFVDLASRMIVSGLGADDLLAGVSVAFPPATPPPLLQPFQEAALMAKSKVLS